MRPNALPLPAPFDLSENGFLPCIALSRAHARPADAVSGKWSVRRTVPSLCIDGCSRSTRTNRTPTPSVKPVLRLSSGFCLFVFGAGTLLRRAQSKRESRRLSCLQMMSRATYRGKHRTLRNTKRSKAARSRLKRFVLLLYRYSVGNTTLKGRASPPPVCPGHYAGVCRGIRPAAWSTQPPPSPLLLLARSPRALPLSAVM